MWLPTEVLIDFVSTNYSLHELVEYGFDIDELKFSVSNYLEDDCKYTHELCGVLLHELLTSYDSDTIKHLETNKQIHHVIWKMETQGTPVRTDDMQNAIAVCEEWIHRLTAETEDLAKLKHLTDTKLRDVLYDHYELPQLKKTPSGAASVDAETIVKLKHYCNENTEYSEAGVFLAKILALKKYQKKLGYLTSYSNCTIDSKVYPNYNIVGTDTLRLSANNPSPQTVSKATNPFEDEFEDPRQYRREMKRLARQMGTKGLKKER
jgi:DNA polymerase I-like protein with 3'-5' exonuclease and polymerase domains